MGVGSRRQIRKSRKENSEEVCYERKQRNGVVSGEAESREFVVALCNMEEASTVCMLIECATRKATFRRKRRRKAGAMLLRQKTGVKSSAQRGRGRRWTRTAEAYRYTTGENSRDSSRGVDMVVCASNLFFR